MLCILILFLSRFVKEFALFFQDRVGMMVILIMVLIVKFNGGDWVMDRIILEKLIIVDFRYFVVVNFREIRVIQGEIKKIIFYFVIYILCVFIIILQFRCFFFDFRLYLYFYLRYYFYLKIFKVFFLELSFLDGENKII